MQEAPTLFEYVHLEVYLLSSVASVIRYSLVLLLFVWTGLTQSAPQSGRYYRLLILDSQQGSPYSEVRHSMLDYLNQYGYVEGKNLELVLHTAGNDTEKAEAILHSQVATGFDVYYMGGTVATVAAKQVLYGKKEPVVFASPTDPVGIGVIDAFNLTPKSNFTGVSYPVPVKSRFRFIRELMPHVKRIGLIYADMPQSHSYNSWIKDMLEKDPYFKDLQVVFRKVPLIKGEDGDKRMAEMAVPLIKELDAKVDLFIKPNDQLGARRHFAEMVYAHATKPLIGIVKNDVMQDWGAMAVVYPSHRSIGRQVADMVRDLFEGKPIKEITPQWPARFGYALDITKAMQFGVMIPVGLLQLAGENIRI
ncbi:MAG: ABC transporter substrate binding protein [Candidatus Thiodiazotropha sp.]